MVIYGFKKLSLLIVFAILFPIALYPFKTKNYKDYLQFTNLKWFNGKQEENNYTPDGQFDEKTSRKSIPIRFHKIEYRKQEPITLQTSLIILLGGNDIFSYGHKIASELYAYTLFPAHYLKSLKLSGTKILAIREWEWKEGNNLEHLVRDNSNGSKTEKLQTKIANHFNKTCG